MQISTELRLASVKLVSTKLVHTKLARAEVELASPKPRELANCSIHSSCMSHTPAAGCTTHSAAFLCKGVRNNFRRGTVCTELAAARRYGPAQEPDPRVQNFWGYQHPRCALAQLAIGIYQGGVHHVSPHQEGAMHTDITSAAESQFQIPYCWECHFTMHVGSQGLHMRMPCNRRSSGGPVNCTCTSVFLFGNPLLVFRLPRL